MPLFATATGRPVFGTRRGSEARTWPSTTTQRHNTISGRSLKRSFDGGAADHNGGYRAMPAASNHHAARLVFQSLSILIADYLPLRSTVNF
jgi:hypothetical protein